jgi:23S rRNA pseudouridine1911/1915/1917 synthase
MRAPGPDCGEEAILDEHEFCIPDGTRKGRADKLLATLIPDLSRSRWQKLFQAGLVWLDDRTLRQKDLIRGGDCIQYTLPPAVPTRLRPVPMPLEVIFEEDSFLVLNKAPGVVVHPGAGTGEDTLVHGLLDHCSDDFAAVGGRNRPGIVHRLDKETSGLMVVAKTEAAYQNLTAQFAERAVRKVYHALVVGCPRDLQGTIEAPIGRHPVQRTKMAVRPNGRPACSDYRVLQASDLAALVEVQIHTGRTHQIRVHLQFHGHPLLGDPLYGYKGLGDITVERVMLHAHDLCFAHPLTGESLAFSCPPPRDFADLTEHLQLRSINE